MDPAKQLADDLKECASVLAGEPSTGSDQFERYRGDPKALVSSVLGSIAAWISAPRGGDDDNTASYLRSVANSLARATAVTKTD